MDRRNRVVPSGRVTADGIGTIQTPLWQARWKVQRGPEVCSDSGLIKACCDLYSSHYGRWGPQGRRPGELIQIAPSQLRELLRSDDSWMVCCYLGDILIGYVVANTFSALGRGVVAWVSQLVVHETYRHSRIGTILLRSIWEFSDYYAWGLVTANPFAVRALEAATRRHVRGSLVRKRAPAMLAQLSRQVPYIPSAFSSDELGRQMPVVDTKFYVSHADLARRQEQAARADRRWTLGNIGDGQEWFACTFGEQPTFPLNAEQWDAVLRSSEDAWLDAFERMTLDEGHRWHSFAKEEMTWILERSQVSETARVVDVGCGDGRHVAELASRGFNVLGLDISPTLIERARSIPTSARFLAWDARHQIPEMDFDLALCLYDVLGSSPDPNDDERILESIAGCLRPGGVLITSAMNEDSLLHRLPQNHRPQQYSEFVAVLDKLPPSRTMQDSGDIHDPQLIVRYQGVYYRKEQFFLEGDRLPREVVVRDRRYSETNLRALLEKAGFLVEYILPVRAGRWERSPQLQARDARAKELLCLCRKA